MSRNRLESSSGSAQAKVDSNDPLAVAEGKFLFQDVVFKRPGEYRFVLDCDVALGPSR